MSFKPSEWIPKTIAFEPFRFWCQKALPNVYDDSLSYYELLCKLVAQLNDVMGTTEDSFNDMVSRIQTFTKELTDEQNQFEMSIEQDQDEFKGELLRRQDAFESDIRDTTQDYINRFEALKSFTEHYFDNLDVQQEINRKLDQMVENGSLTNMVNELFSNLQNQISKLSTGSPKIVDNISKMTDQSFNYVLESTGEIYTWENSTLKNTHLLYTADILPYFGQRGVASSGDTLDLPANGTYTMSINNQYSDLPRKLGFIQNFQNTYPTINDTTNVLQIFTSDNNMWAKIYTGNKYNSWIKMIPSLTNMGSLKEEEYEYTDANNLPLGIFYKGNTQQLENIPTELNGDCILIIINSVAKSDRTNTEMKYQHCIEYGTNNVYYRISLNNVFGSWNKISNNNNTAQFNNKKIENINTINNATNITINTTEDENTLPTNLTKNYFLKHEKYTTNNIAQQEIKSVGDGSRKWHRNIYGNDYTPWVEEFNQVSVKAGLNMIDKTRHDFLIGKYYNSSNVLVTNDAFIQSYLVKVEPKKAYRSSQNDTFVLEYDEEVNYIGYIDSNKWKENNNEYIVSGENTHYMRFITTKENFSKWFVVPYDNIICSQSDDIKLLENMVYSAYGDSITFRNEFQPYLNAMFNFKQMNNFGVGSSTIAYPDENWEGIKPMSHPERIEELINSEPDIVTIFGGINDIAYWEGGRLNGHITMGDRNQMLLPSVQRDKTTFIGAYCNILDSLLSYKSYLRIILIAPYYTANLDRENDLNTGIEYKDINNAVKDIASRYSLPCVDMNTCGFNNLNLADSTYGSDGVHPNRWGGQRIAERLYEEFKKINKFNLRL